MTTAPNNLPPHDREAERALLGGVLRDPDALTDVLALVRPESMYADAHQKILTAMSDLAARSEPVDLVTVHAELHRRAWAADAGGAEYLADLWDATPTSANAEHHARLVRDAASVRGLIGACNEILRDAYSPTAPADELLARAERAVAEVADGAVRAGEPRHVRDLLREALDRLDARVAGGGGLDGLATGYADLDDLLGGLKPGQVIVVGARPSHGKTAMALNLTANIVSRGESALFFSLEMPDAEIAGRLLTMASGVSMHRVSRGARLDADEIDRLVRVASPAGMGGCGLYVADAPDLSATAAAAVLRRQTRKHQVAVAVIDYLQLLRPENPKDNRTQQVGLSARIVKRAARESQVPVVLLCQLNREVENRAGGKPRLADLRESGEIEQHADAVLLLHPHPNQPAESPVWRTDVIVAKNRNGPTGEVTLAYRRPVMRFENCAA